MATFDPVEQRLCVRVVYDGAAGSGKTTNLRQLAALFATQRTTEVHTPAEVEGRTLYFDWMEIHAGVVGGVPLLCQIISVPGQVVLTERRLHLLRSADVVVYVCDSSSALLARASSGISVLRQVVAERQLPPPLVVQANKQDQLDAVQGVKLREVLGCEGDVPCVEAIATDGIGVVDTFVTAIRTFSRAIEARVAREDILLEVRPPESRDAVLAGLAKERLDPEWAAELLLEEASAAYQIELAELSRQTRPLTPATPENALPLLPRADVPTGFIWPAHTGRATLSALDATGALAGRPVVEPSGRIAYHAAGFVLETRGRYRHPNAEAVRQALVRAARERTQLEDLLVPDTVVVAQTAADGSWWIWTVRARCPSLGEALRAVAGDPARRASLLDAFGAALAEAVRLGLRHDLTIELGIDAFGVHAERLRYVGEVGLDPPTASIGDRVSAAMAQLDGAPGDRDAALAAFERTLRSRMRHDDPAEAPLKALLTGGA